MKKKRLSNLVLSNCEWRQGEISAAYRQPFDLLAETVAIAASEKPCGGWLSTGHAEWLGDRDSNPDKQNQNLLSYR